MKRFSVVILLLFAVFILGSNVSVSAETLKEVKSLSPKLDTEIVFEEAELVVDGEDVTFVVVQKFGAEEIVSSEYDIEVDVENSTYTVAERKKINVEDNFAIAATAATVKHLFVTVKTFDPVGLKLNETQAKLWWSPGIKATKVGGNKVCTPSTWPTHWYNQSCITMSDSSMNSGKTYSYGVSAGYYNYDFLSSKKRTDVYHHISLEGYSNGTSWYKATWSKSGEASVLLHFTTGVTKN